MTLNDLVPLDFETGGTDAVGDPVLSVAVWTYSGESFLRYIRPEPGQVVHPGAARVNGYTPEIWASRGAVSLAEAMTDLRAWLVQYKVQVGNPWKLVPLAHNATFDRQFLDAAERRCGVIVTDLLDYRWECSMTLLSALMRAGIVPRGKADLNRLSALAGLPRADIHEALEDARLSALGYQWAMTQMLTGGHATGSKLIQAQGQQLQALESALDHYRQLSTAPHATPADWQAAHTHAATLLGERPANLHPCTPLSNKAA